MSPYVTSDQFHRSWFCTEAVRQKKAMAAHYLSVDRMLTRKVIVSSLQTVSEPLRVLCSQKLAPIKVHYVKGLVAHLLLDCWISLIHIQSFSKMVPGVEMLL